jgi:hypothetical protein
MHDPAMPRVLVLIAVAEVAALLLLSAPANPDKPGVAGGIRTAAAQLRGEGPPIDLVQDYVGARRLVLDGDPYVRLTQAFASVGISWRADHRSTHPPTAFMLVLPVAWLPWNAAAAVWAVLMLGAIAGAWWAFGASPALAAALAPVTLVWPPAAWSLGQLTPLWLLALALAWRFRGSAALAGAAIAFASFTKLLPALSLVPFLVVGCRRAFYGFAAGWAGVLTFLLLLRPKVLEQYVDLARAVGQEQAGRHENSALLWAAGHDLGIAGVAASILLVGAVLLLSLERLWKAGTIDRWSWDAWTWAGVALLPIAWIYSLLPLLPALVRGLRRGRLIVRVLVLPAFVIPYLVDPFGLPGGIRLAIATACLGLALLVLGASAGAHRRPRSQPLAHRSDDPSPMAF